MISPEHPGPAPALPLQLAARARARHGARAHAHAMAPRRRGAPPPERPVFGQRSISLARVIKLDETRKMMQ